MGGYGSGRHASRPTADASLRIDLAWMIRTGRAVPGRLCIGTLSWTRGGECAGAIGYRSDMRDLEAARLELTYSRQRESGPETIRQSVILTHTRPNYGGRRWFMRCPFSGARVGKLYLPPGGDRFAGRAAWRLPYDSQRLSRADRPFGALFRLQRKLGSEPGWEAGICRPRGMWQRTFNRHEQVYWALDEQCALAMARLMAARL